VAFILSFIYYFKKLYLLIRRTLKTKGVEAIKKKLRSRGGEIESRVIKGQNIALFNSNIYSKINYKSTIILVRYNKGA
jgi:Holliday junction resolvase-like predicted endonuclease